MALSATREARVETGRAVTADPLIPWPLRVPLRLLRLASSVLAVGFVDPWSDLHAAVHACICNTERSSKGSNKISMILGSCDGDVVT